MSHTPPAPAPGLADAPPAADPAPEGGAKSREARLRRNYAAVALSGLLSFAAFHPLDFGVLAYVALVPLLIAAALERPKVAALMAYAATVLYHVPGLSWIAMTSPPGWLTTALLEGGYGVALICLPLWIRRRTGTPLVLSLPLLGAALECVRGNFPFVAFPWLFWGHTQHAQLTLAQVADLTSVYGLSALVLGVNGALAEAGLLLYQRSREEHELSQADLLRLRWVMALPVMAIVLALVYGSLRRGQVREAMQEAGPGPRLILVQPNLPQSLKDSGSRVATANDNLNLTKRALLSLGSEEIHGILWSETMWLWPLPDDRPGGQRATYDRWRAGRERDAEFFRNGIKYLRAAQEAGDAADLLRARSNLRRGLGLGEGASDGELIGGAQAWIVDNVTGYASVERELLRLPAMAKAPLFVGAVDLDLEHKLENPHNSYYQLAAADEDHPAQVVARYDKVECVPVAEYIPFKPEDSLLHSFHTFMKGFVPPGFLVFERGAGPVLMDAKGFKLSPNICFEISFPELLRQGTAAGADVHVCPANDAWFVRGDRREPALPTAEIGLARAHSVFRAIENRRSVVRCVNRGVSLCVDPTGEVIDEVQTVTSEGKIERVGIEGTLTVQPPLTKLMSFYVRFGNVFAWLCGLGALALGVLAFRGRVLFPPTEGQPAARLPIPDAPSGESAEEPGAEEPGAEEPGAEEPGAEEPGAEGEEPAKGGA